MNLMYHQEMETRNLLLHRNLDVATRTKDDPGKTDVNCSEVNCSCFGNCIENSRIKPVDIFLLPLFLFFSKFQVVSPQTTENRIHVHCTTFVTKNGLRNNF